MALITLQGDEQVFTRPDREEAHAHAISVYERALAIALEGEEAYVARKLAEYDAVTAEVEAEGFR